LSRELANQSSIAILVKTDEIAARPAGEGGSRVAMGQTFFQAAVATEEMRWSLLTQGFQSSSNLVEIDTRATYDLRR